MCENCSRQTSCSIWSRPRRSYSSAQSRSVALPAGAITAAALQTVTVVAHARVVAALFECLIWLEKGVREMIGYGSLAALDGALGC